MLREVHCNRSAERKTAFINLTVVFHDDQPWHPARSAASTRNRLILLWIVRLLRPPAKDQAAGEHHQADACDVKAQARVADDERERAAERAIRRHRAGWRETHEQEGGHFFFAAIAGELEDFGSLTDELHLPLGEALGERWVIGYFFQELALHGDLLLDLLEVHPELLALPGELVILFSQRQKQADGDDRDAGAQETHRPAAPLLRLGPGIGFRLLFEGYLLRLDLHIHVSPISGVSFLRTRL